MFKYFKNRYDKLYDQNLRILNEIDVLKKLIIEAQELIGIRNWQDKTIANAPKPEESEF